MRWDISKLESLVVSSCTKVLFTLACIFVDNLTPCQKRQRRAKELSASGPNSWNFIPRCREDGGYYGVQCHLGTGQCWCVDQNGNERWGTVVRGLPDCSGMPSIALH